ncbi:ATP synthase subunits region [Paramyrothecium foliicola]|nr:ATP synthase subunits region [Paramyrothecium foliicola]
MTPPAADARGNATPARKKRNIQSVWPDDYLAISSDNQAISFNQDELSDAECMTPGCQDDQKKRLLIRPRVTVNVFNTGGSSTGGSSAGGSGSAAGGSGTGGAATVNGGVSGDPVCCLANQVAALTKKVEALSTNTPSTGVVVDIGKWNTTEVRPWQKPQQHTEARVNFAKEFKNPPSITTGITSIDLCKQANSRVKTFATNVDAKGFTINADSWSDTKLFSCGVSWIAIGE